MHIAEDADYLNALAAEARQECGTNREKLSALPKPVRMRVLRDLLPYTDFTSADIDRLDALLSGQTGDTATLRNGVLAWLDATDPRIGRPEHVVFCVNVPASGIVRLPHGRMVAEPVDRAVVPCKGTEAYVDADRIVGRTIVRNPIPGDRFTPFGMQGSRLLSDYLTDRKVPRFERTMPVVADEAGIIFVVGHTVDERMRVTEHTKHILHYQFEED